MIKTILFLSVFVFLVGCGASGAKPTSKIVLKQTPKWVNSVLPDDDSSHMYGMSIGKNREAAIKAALSSVIARLGTTIESSYESTQKVDGAYANLKIQSTIKADVSKVKINNYSVIKTYKLNYREFAVMVQIDKQKFINGLKEELELKKKELDEKTISTQSMDAIRRYNTKKEIAKRAESLLPVIYILIELDPLFEKKRNLDFVLQQKRVFLKEAQKLKFFVRGNVKSAKFVEKLKNYLAQHGFNVVASKRDAVEIKIETNDNISQGYIKIAVLSVNIKVYDNSKRVGGKEIILKERYNHSVESVYKNASIHLEQDIKKEGINKIIGINLKVN